MIVREELNGQNSFFLQKRERKVALLFVLVIFVAAAAAAVAVAVLFFSLKDFLHRR